MNLFSSMFVLKTAKLRRLTVTAVNGILYDVQLFVENALKNARQKTEEAYLFTITFANFH